MESPEQSLLARKTHRKTPRNFRACALNQRSAEPARVRSAHECAMLWNATDQQWHGALAIGMPVCSRTMAAAGHATGRLI
jgi:squalene cyclase